MNDECLECLARKICDHDEPEEDWSCPYRDWMEEQYEKVSGIYYNDEDEE